MKYRDKKIGVLMGGLSSEREISMRSGKACLKALISRGYNAVAVDAGRELPDTLRKEKIEVAFIALHGRFGEDGTVQGLLELMGIPYTGSGVLASALAINKAATKDVLLARGIRTPAYVTLRSADETDWVVLKFPVVVKPACEGSTIGISVVREGSEMKKAVEAALKHDSLVIVEEFVKGREVTVGVLDGEVLPIVEVRPKSGFYDYQSKYTPGMTEYICPAGFSGEMATRYGTTALSVYNAIGCSGAARVDMIIDDLGPSAIEINTIPGMTETSLLPKAAAAHGMSFEDLVERMVNGAGLKI